MHARSMSKLSVSSIQETEQNSNRHVIWNLLRIVARKPTIVRRAQNVVVAVLFVTVASVTLVAMVVSVSFVAAVVEAVTFVAFPTVVKVEEVAELLVDVAERAVVEENPVDVVDELTSVDEAIVLEVDDETELVEETEVNAAVLVVDVVCRVVQLGPENPEQHESGLFEIWATKSKYSDENNNFTWLADQIEIRAIPTGDNRARSWNDSRIAGTHCLN